MNRRQILNATGAVASLSFCAGVIAGVPGCTSAPAAEPIGPGLALAIERHRSALESLNATCDLLAACEKAERILSTPETRSALQAVEETEVIDNTRLSDARTRLLAEPVTTMAEVRAKARYLARHAPDFAPGDDTATLLASMGAASEIVSDLPAVISDPAHEVLTRYHQQIADFNHQATGISDEDLNALRDETWGPLWEAVGADPSVMPAATTLPGALLALRTMLWEENLQGFDEGCLRSALAYLEGRA